MAHYNLHHAAVLAPHIMVHHRSQIAFALLLEPRLFGYWSDFAVSFGLPPPDLSLTLSGCALYFASWRVDGSLWWMTDSNRRRASHFALMVYALSYLTTRSIHRMFVVLSGF